MKRILEDVASPDISHEGSGRDGALGVPVQELALSGDLCKECYAAERGSRARHPYLLIRKRNLLCETALSLLTTLLALSLALRAGRHLRLLDQCVSSFHSRGCRHSRRVETHLAVLRRGRAELRLYEEWRRSIGELGELAPKQVFFRAHNR
jgi:hypothetical protein